jgi:protocatechuate 3,4-dioxygenase beta subunit
MQKSAFAITGLAVLTPVLTSAFTASESPYLGYNQYAETKSDLRAGIFNTNSVTVKGTIYKKDGTSPIKNATVEVWHLSPNSTKYRHRAKLQTDEQGNYEFITDFPNKEEGKSPRIYFKVSNSEDSSFTELILNNSGAHISCEHWKKNNQLGDKLFPKREDFLNQSTVQFNISI